MGSRDPILATGLPLHGETQAGEAAEQGLWELEGAEHCREMAESAKHCDLRQAGPTGERWMEGSGVSRWGLGLGLPACHPLQEHRTPLHSASGYTSSSFG